MERGMEGCEEEGKKGWVWGRYCLTWWLRIKEPRKDRERESNDFDREPYI